MCPFLSTSQHGCKRKMNNQWCSMTLLQPSVRGLKYILSYVEDVRGFGSEFLSCVRMRLCIDVRLGYQAWPGQFHLSHSKWSLSYTLIKHKHSAFKAKLFFHAKLIKMCSSLSKHESVFTSSEGAGAGEMKFGWRRMVHSSFHRLWEGDGGILIRRLAPPVFLARSRLISEVC